MATEADFLVIAGSEQAAVDFENAALCAPKLTLPECAQDVLDGRGSTPRYWAWLIESFVAAGIVAANMAARERPLSVSPVGFDF